MALILPPLCVLYYFHHPIPQQGGVQEGRVGVEVLTDTKGPCPGGTIQRTYWI